MQNKEFNFKEWYQEKRKEGHYFYLGREEIEDCIDKISFYYSLLVSNEKLQGRKEGDTIFVLPQIQQEITLEEELAFQCYYRSYGQYAFPVLSYSETRKMSQERVKKAIYLSILLNGRTVDIEASVEGMVDSHTLEDCNIYSEPMSLEELLNRLPAENEQNCYSQLRKCIQIHDIDCQLRDYMVSSIAKQIMTERSILGPERSENWLQEVQKTYHLQLKK